LSADSNSGAERLDSDERALRDLLSGLFAMPAVLVAHDIGLFALLAERPSTLAELSRRLDLEGRPLEALLAMCAAVGLVRFDSDRYALRPLAEAFFAPGAPTSYGSYWDMLIRRRGLYTFDALRQAILTNTPSYERLYPGGPHSEREPDWPTVFTRAMHCRGRAAARAWPQRIDLSTHETFLDVGGGSGVHAIEAVKRWPNLRAIVFERAPVCKVAADCISEEALEGRIRLHAGDFWAADPFPAADVHFYSEVFHNHSLEQCRALARKSFEDLPAGGRILVHEMLLGDDHTGPAPVAAAFLNMLLWSKAGRQYTRDELSGVLSAAGFREIRTIPTCGYFSITSACKPAPPEGGS